MQSLGLPKELEDLQKKIVAEVEVFKSLQGDFQKGLGIRQTLEAQLHENESVYSELILVKDDAKVCAFMLSPLYVLAL